MVFPLQYQFAYSLTWSAREKGEFEGEKTSANLTAIYGRCFFLPDSFRLNRGCPLVSGGCEIDSRFKIAECL